MIHKVNYAKIQHAPYSYIPYTSVPTAFKLNEISSLNEGFRTETGLGSYAPSKLPRESGSDPNKDERTES